MVMRSFSSAKWRRGPSLKLRERLGIDKNQTTHHQWIEAHMDQYREFVVLQMHHCFSSDLSLYLQEYLSTITVLIPLKDTYTNITISMISTWIQKGFMMPCRGFGRAAQCARGIWLGCWVRQTGFRGPNLSLIDQSFYATPVLYLLIWHGFQTTWMKT